MKPRQRQPIGRFRFDAKGTPAAAVQYADGTWAVVPVEGSGPAPLAEYHARYLNALYGPTVRSLLPAGMGLKYARLFHAAMADLAGTDGWLLQPPPDPPGTVH